jgi:hypothetical protein
MAKFKDKNGREWQVNFTVGVMRDVKRELGVDLLGPEPVTGAAGIFQNIGTLIDVAWLAARDQAGTVTDEEFGRALDAESVLSLQRAVVEGLVDFFPRPATKRALAEAIVLMDKMMSKAVEEALKKAEKAELAETLGA